MHVVRNHAAANNDKYQCAGEANFFYIKVLRLTFYYVEQKTLIRFFEIEIIVSFIVISGCASLMYLENGKMSVSLSFGRKVITNKTLSSKSLLNI